MKQGLGLNKILGTIHTYPTLAEANKYAAGEWKKAHAPEKLLTWGGEIPQLETGKKALKLMPLKLKNKQQNRQKSRPKSRFRGSQTVI